MHKNFLRNYGKPESPFVMISCLVVCCCRFSLVYRAGQAVTALCCSISRPSEVFVGLPDHSVLCVDLGTCLLTDHTPRPHPPIILVYSFQFQSLILLIAHYTQETPYMYVCTLSLDTGELVATLRGHATSVKSLSIHSSGRLLLAVSLRDCVLWDLDSFSRHRTLNGGQDVGVQDVSSLLYTPSYTLFWNTFAYSMYFSV